MKKNKLIVMGVLTALLTLVLVLASCDNGTTPTPTPSPEAMAIQLAADINAMEGQSSGSVGRAEANGATVKITDGFVDFRANITVPVGVTFDVTGGVAAIGLHNVTLTVNGTVYANSNAIGLEDSATWGIINGSGNIYLKSKGRLLDVSESRTLTLDGVTLVGQGDNDTALVEVRTGGEFVLKSGKITGNTAEGGGGVIVCNDATFTMEGGEISGNTAGEGGAGGVRVNDTAEFTMKGGKICGNTATEWGGGGVLIGDDATFTMKGGEISGNIATDHGGGVCISDGGDNISANAEFIMEGGEIRGNTANNGGGVLAYEKRISFTKKGGIIYGDTDTTHAPGDIENTSLEGNGHAVSLGGDEKKRDATAGPNIELYAKCESESGPWTYNDISDGGVGNTTENWEDWDLGS